jgi:signal transduction histidine kinase
MEPLFRPVRPVLTAVMPSSSPHPADAPGGRPAASGATPADLARAVAAIEIDVALTAARLEELDRLQALVVSTTAHDLRTPLTVLRVHADLLCEAGSTLGPDERASLQAIGDAVARLQAVSDQLVDDLRDGAGGAEEALRRWLQVEPGDPRTRPTTA